MKLQNFLRLEFLKWEVCWLVLGFVLELFFKYDSQY